MRWDVLEGLVSIERAAAEYGVILKETEETVVVDHNATTKLRKQKQREAAQ